MGWPRRVREVTKQHSPVSTDKEAPEKRRGGDRQQPPRHLTAGSPLLKEEKLHLRMPCRSFARYGGRAGQVDERKLL
jgi:hypothetical protein